jgi:thioredoxin 2
MTDSLHIVCPHCDAVNRIPAARLQQAPRCGKCHEVLFGAHPVELNSSRFEKHLARSDIPLLVDFWAPWCGPCKMMAPQFEQAAQQLEPGFRLVKVNTEVEQQLGAKYGIRSIPTLALFQRGRELARQAGAIGTADIVRWAQAHRQ